MVRLIVGILGAFACALLSSHRSGLSVAIVSMVKYNNSLLIDQNSGSCVSSNVTNTEDTISRGEFEWSESLQGIILGASFYAFLLTPTLSGRITERFGAKWLTAITLSVPAILFALIPIAAEINVYLMIAILVIMGFFEGYIFASLFSLYANWFPGPERASAIAGIAAGSNFGNMIAFPVAGYLCENGFAGGWASVFYVISLAHIPWLILWFIFVEDSPSKSNTSGFYKISDSELLYIQKNIASFGAPKKSSAPWLKILKSKAVWSSTISKISAGWGYYLLLSKMPSYLDKVFGISLIHNGLFNSMTALATGVTMLLGGPISGFIIRKTSKRLTKTRVRKIFQDIALLGPAICLALVPAMGCNSNAVVALLIIALFLYGFMTGGEFPIIAEFAPDFSGTVFGIEATVSIFPAFLAPYVVGVLLGDKSGEKSRWNLVFYITIAIYVLGALVFELFASAQPQKWGLMSKSDTRDQKSTENGINKLSTTDLAEFNKVLVH